MLWGCKVSMRWEAMLAALEVHAPWVFFFLLIFTYLPLAVLGPYHYGGYSLVAVQASHCSGFSCCGVWALVQAKFQ